MSPLIAARPSEEIVPVTFDGPGFKKHLSGRHALFTGRASTAIYLILRSLPIEAQKVLLPASICYAAVYPVIYSRNAPLFLDVGDDGNLTLDVTAQACEENRGIAAIVLPHMYGNPCGDFDAICRYCRQRGIVVIEDCASAMGVRTQAVSDYTVYSFGYAKTLEAGFGGLITSPSSLAKVAELNDSLLPLDDAIRGDEQLFSDLYRIFKRKLGHPLVQAMLPLLPAHFGNCFVHRLAADQQAVLWNLIDDLGQVVADRIAKARLYAEHFRFSPTMREYPFHAGAVPWRFNILVDRRYKAALIDHLLRQHVPVSDWYPVIAPLFGQCGVSKIGGN